MFLCEDCREKIFSNLKFHEVKKFGTTIYCGAAYENELLKVIRGFKYHKKSDFRKILSDIIIKTVENYNINIEDFVICPVPIHEKRFKKRKYNHMELVAEDLAKHFNIELKTDLLKRIKDTVPLYKLSITERKTMIKGAFEVSKEIKAKKILLIDDILTTGTTIEELSRLILSEEPQKYIVITASRSNKCNF
ncbi:MAG: hypothetical protein MJ180_01315 [Candidatus Gastranaerophilales bacterium]|nr:hypothetical protein [Candidatus Gastranaerophilales bacterium]